MMKNKKILLISLAIIVIISGIVSVCLVMFKVNKKEPSQQITISKCSPGYISVPGNSKFHTKDFCVMKYEAKNINGVAKSDAKATPWTEVSQTAAIDLAKNACSGCHLITENEWLTIANEITANPANWSDSALGKGFVYSGHNDNSPALALGTYNDDSYMGTENSKNSSQKRTLKLTNGETIWDFSGNVAEWTDGQITGGQPGTGGEKFFSWKEWNLIDFNGYLPVNPFPSYINKKGGSWGSEQGMGQLYSNSTDSELRGFVRGGDFSQGVSAGVFSLNLSNSITDSSPLIGFRVAK